MLQCPHIGRKIVAGSTAHSPAVVQHFARRQDLLDHDPGCLHRRIRRPALAGFLHGALEPAAIRERIRQAVDMVDSQPVDHPFAIKPKHQTMYGFEDVVVLHPHADQPAFFKEPAPVDGLRGTAPLGQTIVLPFQKLMQALPPLTVTRIVGRQRGLALTSVFVQRAGSHRIRHASRHDVEAPLRFELQADFSGAQRLVIRLTEKGCEHPARLGRCIPINVEPGGVRATLAVFQNIPPPGVVGARSHVVRHDIEQNADASFSGGFSQAAQGRLAAALRIDDAMIDHVIAMHRTRSGTGQR